MLFEDGGGGGAGAGELWFFGLTSRTMINPATIMMRRRRIFRLVVRRW